MCRRIGVPTRPIEVAGGLESCSVPAGVRGRRPYQSRCGVVMMIADDSQGG
jgi:hypothetical protein